MDPGAPSREEVREWLEAVQLALDSVQDRLAPLLEEQRRLETRQALLKDLLSSFETPLVEEEPQRGPSRPWTLSVQPAGSVGDYVRDRSEEILREAGTPMHINELHREFARRGYHIPGAGKPANLIVHLRASSEIASPARGLYGLAGQVSQVPSGKSGTRKRRKRAR